MSLRPAALPGKADVHGARRRLDEVLHVGALHREAATAGVLTQLSEYLPTFLSKRLQDVANRVDLQWFLEQLWWDPYYEEERKGINWFSTDVHQNWMDQVDQFACAEVARLRKLKRDLSEEEEIEWMAWIHAVAEEFFIVYFEHRKQNEIRRSAKAKGQLVNEERLKARLEWAREGKDKLLDQRKQVIEEKKQELRERQACTILPNRPRCPPWSPECMPPEELVLAKRGQRPD